MLDHGTDPYIRILGCPNTIVYITDRWRGVWSLFIGFVRMVSLSLRGKTPRTMKKKKQDDDEEACGVETTALSIYFLCGAIAVGCFLGKVLQN